MFLIVRLDYTNSLLTLKYYKYRMGWQRPKAGTFYLSFPSKVDTAPQSNSAVLQTVARQKVATVRIDDGTEFLNEDMQKFLFRKRNAQSSNSLILVRCTEILRDVIELLLKWPEL